MIRIEHGDMRDVLARLIADKTPVHAIVTDPPYHLTNNTGSRSPNPGQYTPIGKPKEPKGGFMGKQWDGGDIAFQSGTWRLCFDLLPPGGHLLAFSGTRTYHRMVLAIEEAGFEIRDTIAWLYGSGFPKSRNLHGQWEGWGTALKPALEPICLARKPLVGTVAGNVLKHGTGALNIDGCRINAPEGLSTGGVNDHTDAGWGMGPIRSEAHSAGRWPANVVHDGSDEVVSAFPETQSGTFNGNRTQDKFLNTYGAFKGAQAERGYEGNTGSAARFFYSAKADAGDRLGSKHPTIKPVDLMRWLVRLITPPGGTVLDPFAGSGTTGMACMAEGFDAILVDSDPESIADIRRRVAHVHGDDTPLFARAAE